MYKTPPTYVQIKATATGESGNRPDLNASLPLVNGYHLMKSRRENFESDLQRLKFIKTFHI